MGKRMAGAMAMLSIVVSACVPAPAMPIAPRVAGTAAEPGDAQAAVSIIDQRLRRAWPDDPNGAAWFGSGGYQLMARHAGEFVAVRAPTVGAVDDVVLTGTFRKVGGPPGGGYGLIVRDRRAGAGDGVDQAGQFVVAAVGDRGDVGVWQREGQRWIDLVPWTASPSVRQGGSPNELKVQVTGNRLRFDVNGTQVAALDVALNAGRVGIFVGGDQNEVLVDRLVVQPLATAKQVDLSAKEQDLARASEQLAALSERAKVSTTNTTPTVPAEDDGRWRQDLGGILAVVQLLGRDVETDYAGSGRDTSRISHIGKSVVELEQDVVAILDYFSDGFDSPRSPVNNRAALEAASARLAEAGRKAERLKAELQAVRAAYEADTR
jgi:hypothetical protein